MLHQPECVEALEKIVEFAIKEHALSLSVLAPVETADHEAVVKSVHDFLIKLTRDFNGEQLDDLFECFEGNWLLASERQRDLLLGLIRRLLEDDENCVKSDKVLTMFWDIAHVKDVSTEVMNQALAEQVKILDRGGSKETVDAQRKVWLDKCVVEIKSGLMWALPALKQIRQICCLYKNASELRDVIERCYITELVINSLRNYMEYVRLLIQKEATSEINCLLDKRYCHELQIQERLDSIKFDLVYGEFWLSAKQANRIWQCLAENAAFASDREICVKWFSTLLGDLEPDTCKDILENKILKFDPTLLTESKFEFFEKFFKAVNLKKSKLRQVFRNSSEKDYNIIGLDYLWKVLTLSSDDIVLCAAKLLKEIKSLLTKLNFHEPFITDCFDRLRTHYIAVMRAQKAQNSDQIVAESAKMFRTVSVLLEDRGEGDRGEWKVSPLHR